MNHSIWGALQQFVYRCRRIRDIEHLKEVLQYCWEEIGQNVIDRAIGQFRKRLSLVVATGGGHMYIFIFFFLYLMVNKVDYIEHRFDLCLVLHVHYHAYVFCCRNTQLGRQK